jgi:hypothetical protein
VAEEVVTLRLTAEGLDAVTSTGQAIATLGKQVDGVVPPATRLNSAMGQSLRGSQQLSIGMTQLVGVVGRISPELDQMANGFLSMTGAAGQAVGAVRNLQQGLAGLSKDAGGSRAAMLGWGAVGVGAVAGLAAKTKELADAWVELRDVQVDADAAQRASETATGRQVEQMARLAEILGTTSGELAEFSTGMGAKGFAALVEHAARNPEGRIARAFEEMTRPAREAHQAAVRLAGVLDEFAGLTAQAAKTAASDLAQTFAALAERTGSAASASVLLGDRIGKVVGDLRLLGQQVPENLEGIHGLSVAMEEFGLMTAEQLGARAQDVVLAFQAMSDQGLTLQAALERVGPTAIEVATRFREMGKTVPSALAGIVTMVNAFSAAAEEMGPRVGRGAEEAGRALKALADEQARTAEQARATQQALLHQFEDVRTQLDIGSERRVDVPAGSPEFQRILERARGVAGRAGAAGGYVAQFAAAFARNLTGGDLGALETLVKQLKAQVKFFEGVPGLELRGLSDFRGAVLELEKLLRDFQRLVGDRPQRRQAGGFVARGGAYVVGEAGPEVFFPRSDGFIGSNADLREQARSIARLAASVERLSALNVRGGRGAVEAELPEAAVRRVLGRFVAEAIERNEARR